MLYSSNQIHMMSSGMSRHVPVTVSLQSLESFTQAFEKARALLNASDGVSEPLSAHSSREGPRKMS